MDPEADKLIRRTTIGVTVVAAYLLLTADYDPNPNVLDPSRWKQEEKMKEQAREQLEALAKSKEDMIIPKAESDFQRYQDVIRRLEKEIAQLRLKTDSFKIAALHWGTDVTYAFCLTNSKSIPAVEETGPHYVSEINVDFHGDVACDRECVMCFSDEMFDVFLPCAHQVVCVKCNELHQKHGMKECPSCRIPIQRRINLCSFC